MVVMCQDKDKIEGRFGQCFTEKNGDHVTLFVLYWDMLLSPSEILCFLLSAAKNLDDVMIFLLFLWHEGEVQAIPLNADMFELPPTDFFLISCCGCIK